MTAEAGVTEVKAGDGVAVVYTEPSSYTYTHVDTGSSIEQARSQSTSKVPSSKVLNDNLLVLDALKSKTLLIQRSDFSVQGYYINSTGGLTANPDAECTPLIDISTYLKLYVNVRCAGTAYCAYYAADGTTMLSSFQTSTTNYEKLVDIPVGAVYVRLSNSKLYYTGNYAVGYKYSLDDALSNKLFSDLFQNVKKYINTDFSVIGKYLDSTGALIDNPESSCTGFIDCENKSEISVYLRCAGSAYCVFFAADQSTVISKFQTATDNYYKTVEVPFGARYVRLCNKSADPKDGYAFLYPSPKVNQKRLELLNAIDGYLPDITIASADFTLNGYLDSTGTLVSNDGYKSTPFYYINNYNRIHFYAKIAGLAYAVLYDSNKVVIDVIQTSTTNFYKKSHLPVVVKYVRFCNNFTTVPSPTITISKKSNYWDGKIIAWYGTSIPAGFPKGASQAQITAGLQDYYSYANRAAKRLNATIKNYCVPSGHIRKQKVDGTTFVSTQSFTNLHGNAVQYGALGLENVNYQNSMLDLIGTANEPDLFVFDYLVNDQNSDGTDFADGYTPDYTSYDPKTFVGAYNLVLKSLFTAKPNARVLLVSHFSNDGGSTGSSLNYHGCYINGNQIIKKIAEHWNCQLFEPWKYSEVFNNSMKSNFLDLMVDGLHPANSSGLELLEKLSEAHYSNLKNNVK